MAVLGAQQSLGLAGECLCVGREQSGVQRFSNMAVEW